MQNATRGKDFASSLRADAMQARVVFDDGTPAEHQMHINLFYSTHEEKPYMIVKHGGFKNKPPYDNTGPETLPNNFPFQRQANSTGTIVMDNAGNVSDGIFFATVDGRTGSYPNLYGCHDAPAARRGRLIAPFRTNGVIEDVPGIGSMTALA